MTLSLLKRRNNCFSSAVADVFSFPLQNNVTWNSRLSKFFLWQTCSNQSSTFYLRHLAATFLSQFYAFSFFLLFQTELWFAGALIRSKRPYISSVGLLVLFLCVHFCSVFILCVLVTVVLARRLRLQPRFHLSAKCKRNNQQPQQEADFSAALFILCIAHVLHIWKQSN